MANLNILKYFKKKFSGAAAAWEANAGMGGRLQLWNHVKLLSRAALWPGDHKDGDYDYDYGGQVTMRILWSIFSLR